MKSSIFRYIISWAMRLYYLLISIVGLSILVMCTQGDSLFKSGLKIQDSTKEKDIWSPKLIDLAKTTFEEVKLNPTDPSPSSELMGDNALNLNASPPEAELAMSDGVVTIAAAAGNASLKVKFANMMTKNVMILKGEVKGIPELTIRLY